MRQLSNRFFALCCGVLVISSPAPGRGVGRHKLDPVSQEQAELEKKVLAEGLKHTLSPALAEFRKTGKAVEYTSGKLTLPGHVYRPSGDGPFPAVIWIHGSGKNPGDQPELARFYTAHGYVFFMPIRHGHGKAPGDYISDLIKELKEKEKDASVVRRRVVELHELYNADVVAAVAFLRKHSFVDPERIIMSGLSFGRIQTLLAAETGLGVRAFIPFAAQAMSFANTDLQERLKHAAKNAKAPVFLLQARNDFNLGPSKNLAPILKQRGAPNHSKIYAEFGSTHEHGHGAFATWSLGASIWGDDVLHFIDASLKIPVLKR